MRQFGRHIATGKISGKKPVLLSCLTLVLLLAACASKPEAEAIAKFAQALDATSTGLQISFAKVSEAAAERSVLERATNYIVTGTANLKPEVDASIKPEALKARLEAIEGLATYAKLLAVLSDSDLIGKVDAGFTAAGNQLTSLKDTLKPFAPSGGPQINEQIWTLGVTAFREIGKFLIDWKLRRELTKSIREMHPHISAVSDLLKADLGDTNSGLRGILASRVSNLEFQHKTLLSLVHGDSRVDQMQKYALFRETESKVIAWRRADVALEEASKALPKMVEAHKKLSESDKESALDAAKEFFAQAQKIALAIKAIVSKDGV